MTDARLVIRHLNKAYATPVLVDVDLAVAKGEIHAIVGENGAGKSTLVNILGGLVGKDNGEILLDGKCYEPGRVVDAFAAGISVAAQELATIGTLSVAENIGLRSLPGRFAVVDRARLHETASRMLRHVGLDAIHADTPLERLSLAERQLVEIARAFAGNARLLILDEPTAALSAAQAARLHDMIRERASSGTSIIYISHRLDDVLDIAARVTVLRDGRVVRSGPTANLSVDDLVEAMAGEALRPRQAGDPDSAAMHPLIRADAITTTELPEPITLTGNGGEIIGIAGLAGAGRSELLHALFRLAPLTGGSVCRFVEGCSVPVRSATHAMRSGMAFLGEDRKEMGIYSGRSVLINMMVPGKPASSSPLLRIDRIGEYKAAAELTRRLDIRYHDLDQDIAELSGGNQQKALIGRWLHCEADVFLLDEPTRGVDVGTKSAIYDLLSELGESGKCILIASSEIEELMAVCSRIIVLSKRKLVRSFERGEWSEAEILAAAFQEFTEAKDAAPG